MKFIPLAVALGLAAPMLAAGCSTHAGSDASTALLLDSSGGDDWPGYGRTFGEQHYSPLSDINDGNVGDLSLAWYLDLGPGNPATQPIEIGDRLYFAMGMSIVHAVDATTGKLLWQYDPRIADQGSKGLRLFWGTRGIAWWDGKLYVGTGDGRLIALDAETGKLLWEARTLEKDSGQYITGAPRVFDGKVIIGQAGADMNKARGYVTTYDAETGEQLWRFYTVPGNPADGFENKAMEMAAKTWTGGWWQYGGGGTPWNAMAYDPETETILFGTGNGFPWNQKVRSPGGGDNLFLCSLLALDANTGEYKWHYQFNPGDTWDYNATMDVELADLEIGGELRKVAMIAPKNGFFYVIDRTSGKLISAEKYAKVTWAEKIDIATGRPVETPGARFPDGQSFELWPSTRGAHGWAPMAFSPQTKLMYLPKMEWGMTLNDRGVTKEDWHRDTIFFSDTKPNPLNLTSALVAWDPVRQKAVWQVPNFGGVNGGTMATGGNLVFQGQINGRFSAYAADSGKELWHFPAQAAIVAAPITYKAGGSQYVSIMAGMGSGVATPAENHGGLKFDNRTQKKRLLTFAIGGSAKLPPAPPRFVLTAPDDPDYRPDPDMAMKGAMLYGSKHCWLCHGPNVNSGGAAPDLRGSPLWADSHAFASVVRDGALAVGGMPQFGELTDAELEALRQYVRSRAADLRAGKP